MIALLIPAENSPKQKLNFSRCALFYMKTRVSLKHFVSYCAVFKICKSRCALEKPRFRFFTDRLCTSKECRILRNSIASRKEYLIYWDTIFTALCITAFTCNTKSFTIVFLFFLFFFFPLSDINFGQTYKIFLTNILWWLPRKRVIVIVLISLEILKNVLMKMVPFVVIPDACGTWHSLIHNNQHSQHPKKHKKQLGTWKKGS